MDSKNIGHQNWINPLLSQLDLAKSENGLVDFEAYWAQLEECRLPERIRQIVAGVNGAAGYHVLELLDFLQPQRLVLRIKFSKTRTEHIMEVVLREHGPAVKFYSRRRISDAWERFLPNSLRMRSRTLIFEQDLRPAETLEEDIQAWISYLLSGFEKKFKPNVRQKISENSELRMSAAVGKASA